MDILNLPKYNFKFREENGRKFIFDKIRKKYVVLTPEEWVRQNFIEYLVNEKGYPRPLMCVEHSIKVNKLNRRGDIVIYNKQGNPEIIVECKAPQVNITQEVFDQVACYNIPLKVNYLVVTNGLKHYCCKIDFEKGKYLFIDNMPSNV